MRLQSQSTGVINHMHYITMESIPCVGTTLYLDWNCELSYSYLCDWICGPVLCDCLWVCQVLKELVWT